jgi:hypothetical protein
MVASAQIMTTKPVRNRSPPSSKGDKAIVVSSSWYESSSLTSVLCKLERKPKPELGLVRGTESFPQTRDLSLPHELE